MPAIIILVIDSAWDICCPEDGKAGRASTRADNQERTMAGKNALVMCQNEGDVGIVRFLTSQVLDELNVQQLGQELEDLVEKQYTVKMVINFEKVKFLSSAVLGKLISLHKRIASEKGRMGLCCINPSIMQVFKITRLDKLIPIYDTEETAVKGVGKPGLFGRFGRK